MNNWFLKFNKRKKKLIGIKKKLKSYNQHLLQIDAKRILFVNKNRLSRQEKATLFISIIIIIMIFH